MRGERCETRTLRELRGERLAYLARVADEDEVRLVVLRRVGGVDVYREQPPRRGLRPVLRHRAVEVAADRDDDVRVVPQRSDLGHVEDHRVQRGGDA